MKKELIFTCIGILIILAIAIYIINRQEKTIFSDTQNTTVPQPKNPEPTTTPPNTAAPQVPKPVGTNEMSLTTKSLTWIETTEGNKKTTPKKVGDFVLTFTPEGTYHAKTDCNGIGGSYTVKGQTLTLGPGAMTMMYCDGSQDMEFGAMLSKVEKWTTASGTVSLILKNNSGTMLFK